MWWVSTQKNGASALGLQRVLGLKKSKTAWTILHKLPRETLRPGRDCSPAESKWVKVMLAARRRD
jgi:hypothetical protein